MSTGIRDIERGDVSRSLEGKSVTERAVLRADAYTKASLPTTFEHDGLSISVVEGPVRDGTMLRVTLAATQDGKPIALNNPYLFVNPPVMVRESDPETGETVLREDLDAAWQAMIGQAVAGSVKRSRGR
jgi:hypothetical protein